MSAELLAVPTQSAFRSCGTGSLRQAENAHQFQVEVQMWEGESRVNKSSKNETAAWGSETVGFCFVFLFKFRKKE